MYSIVLYTRIGRHGHANRATDHGNSQWNEKITIYNLKLTL